MESGDFVDLRRSFEWTGTIVVDALAPAMKRLLRQFRQARHQQVRFERYFTYGEGWMVFCEELERRTRERLGMEPWDA